MNISERLSRIEDKIDSIVKHLGEYNTQLAIHIEASHNLKQYVDILKLDSEKLSSEIEPLRDQYKFELRIKKGLLIAVPIIIALVSLWLKFHPA